MDDLTGWDGSTAEAMRYELDWETKGGRATRYTRRQIIL